MLSNSLKGMVLIAITAAVCASGVVCTRGDGTAYENGFREIVSFINKVKRPPDYVKGGEWPVDYLYDCHGAPPAPVVIAPTGDVYVASRGHVQYFSSTGFRLGECEMPDSPFPCGYFGLAIAPDKTVFAADHSAGRVYRFTPGGRLMPAWEAEVGPLAMAPNGDIYASTGRRIQRYDVSGNLRGEWGSYGTGEGEFRLPLDLSVGPDGTVYVLDSGFGGVQYFTPEGSFLGRWGPDGFKYGRYKNPRGIAAGPDGKVYVLENSAVGANYRFDYFTATGSFLGSYDLPDNYSTAYGSGIAVASDGTVYISDRGDERIHYYEPSRVFHVIRYVVFAVIALLVVIVFTFLVRFFLGKLKRQAAR